jgi:hypothetical protein
MFSTLWPFPIPYWQVNSEELYFLKPNRRSLKIPSLTASLLHVTNHVGLTIIAYSKKCLCVFSIGKF